MLNVSTGFGTDIISKKKVKKPTQPIGLCTQIQQPDVEIVDKKLMITTEARSKGMHLVKPHVSICRSKIIQIFTK